MRRIKRINGNAVNVVGLVNQRVVIPGNVIPVCTVKVINLG